MRNKSLFFIAALVLAVSLCSCGDRSGDIGSKSNPVRFFFMPLKGESAFQTNAPILKKFLETHTGLSIETVHADDFIAIVKAFGQKKADIAFTNTLGYLLAHDWTNAEAHLRYVYGDVYTTYRGEILAKTDGVIKAPADIAGKVFAFVDPYSTTGYLYPLKYLDVNKIAPKKEFFAGGHIKAVEALYKGEADAAATYHEHPTATGNEQDARIELMAKYPDILSKLKIVALTDEVPTGPIALRQDVPTAVKAKLVGALLEFARTAEGRATLMNLYNITGFNTATDNDYDGVRATIKQVGKTIQQLVPGGGPYYRTYIVPGLE